MNRGETNFSRSPKSLRFWQGAMYHIWTSHFDKHWRHSQKRLQKYDIRDRHFIVVCTCVLRKLGSSPKLAIFPWPTSYSPLNVQLLESSMVEFLQLDPKKAQKPLLAPKNWALKSQKTNPSKLPGSLCIVIYIQRSHLWLQTHILCKISMLRYLPLLSIFYY